MTWNLTVSTNTATTTNWTGLVQEKPSDFENNLEDSSDKLKVLLFKLGEEEGPLQEVILSVCDLVSAMGKEIDGLHRKIASMQTPVQRTPVTDRKIFNGNQTYYAVTDEIGNIVTDFSDSE
jgi:hypothetical protein